MPVPARDAAVVEPHDAAFDVTSVVARAQGGDEVAFAELYVLFFRRIERYLTMRLGSVEEAQDVAQDVFERLITALPGYDQERGPFRSWVFAIARNMAIDSARRSDRVSPASPEVLQDRLDTHRGRAATGGRGDVGAMLDELPAAQRRVLVLRFAYELPSAEIAELVASTPEAVRQLQRRGLQELASRFTPESLVA
jgi:RNA polymerase sigma-70 factor (ECF subfamily)